MKLFSKYESCYYEAITKMLFEPPMTEIKARKFIEKNIDIEGDFKFLNHILTKDEDKSSVFEYDYEKKVFKPTIKNEMPIILNKIELEALKNLIDMDVVRAFLEDETISKLKSKLDSIEKRWNIEDIKYKRQYSDGDKNNIEDINKNIKILIKAINKKCAIKCDNYTRNKDYKNQIVYPLKIEYSLINDKYRIYTYIKDDNGQKIYIKMNISNLKNLELLEENLREKDDEFLEFNKKNIRTITLYVDSENHVIERCFRIFSFYDRRALYDEKEDKYILEIDYYFFDEADIIKNILSLGSRVVVKSPDDIRDKIVLRVKKALSNY